MTQYIEIEKLRHHPSNPRKDFGDLTELAESIKTQGLICPLLVVPHEEDYYVIAGNRRLEACKLANVPQVYCEVAEVSDEDAIGLMLSENIIRQNLSSIEEAQGFQLMLDMGKDVEQISNETGFKTETVKLRTKLNKLNKDNLQKAYDAGATLYELAAVADIEDEKEREKLLKKAGTRDFNNALQRIKDEKAKAERLVEIEQFLRDHEFEQFDDYKYDKGYVILSAKDSEGNVIAQRGYMLNHVSYSIWNDRTPTEEDFEPGVKYYFRKDYSGYTVYRDATQEEIDAKTEFDQKAAEKAEAQERVKAEVRDINERHLKLREDFILNFNDFKKKQKEFKAMLLYTMNQFIYEKKGTWHLDEDVNDLLDKLQGKSQSIELSLLIRAYAVLEGGSFVRTEWNADTQNYVPTYFKSEPLLALYDHLKALGYQMSEEEELVANGTHPIYVQPEPAEVDNCDDGYFGDEDEDECESA